MNRMLIIPAVMALAAGPLLLNASPASAEGLFQRGKSSHSHKQTRSRAVRPQVRGFLFQPGGFSYVVPDSYSYDYAAQPPRDFGPYLDYGPTANGIIPNDAYR